MPKHIIEENEVAGPITHGGVMSPHQTYSES